MRLILIPDIIYWGAAYNSHLRGATLWSYLVKAKSKCEITQLILILIQKLVNASHDSKSYEFGGARTLPASWDILLQSTVLLNSNANVWFKLQSANQSRNDLASYSWGSRLGAAVGSGSIVSSKLRTVQNPLEPTQRPNHHNNNQSL